MVALDVIDLVIAPSGDQVLLGDVTLSVAAGSALAVVGPSGSGKTSLLNCLAGITTPAGGSVAVGGTEITRLSAAQRAAFRLTNVGIVFQFGELLPELTVLQTVALPARLTGVRSVVAEQDAMEWLEQLSLMHLAQRAPTTLSGGETQRVGVARALARRPVLVVADEPTGMLDEKNSYLVTDLLLTASRRVGAAVVLATHDAVVAAAADRILHVHERRLCEASGSSGDRLRV